MAPRRTTSAIDRLPRRDPEQPGDNPNPYMNALPSMIIEVTDEMAQALSELEKVHAEREALGEQIEDAAADYDIVRLGQLRLTEELFPARQVAAELKVATARAAAAQVTYQRIQEPAQLYADAVEEAGLILGEARQVAYAVETASMAAHANATAFRAELTRLENEVARLRALFSVKARAPRRAVSAL